MQISPAARQIIGKRKLRRFPFVCALTSVQLYKIGMQSGWKVLSSCSARYMGSLAKGPYAPRKQPSMEARLLAEEVQSDVGWHFQEPNVDVDDIQGDAFLGFNKPHMAILAIDIADDTPATIENTKKWLHDYVIPSVTSARDVIQFRKMFRRMREKRHGLKPTSVYGLWVNLSFSYDALLKLAPVDDVEKFYQPGYSSAFKVGLKNRSAYLRDPQTGIGAVKNWVVGAEQNPHILIQIASDCTSLIANEICSLEKGLTDLCNPAEVKYKEYGKRREDLPGHEHFGFLDGISNVGLRGVYEDDLYGKPQTRYITPRFLDVKDPRASLYGLPGQQLVWPGEIVLGLPKQNQNTTDPEKWYQPGSTSFIGPEWSRNGTFLVYRRLKQDVPKFWNFVKESASEIAKRPCMAGFSDQHMGAKIVSRWTSGTPVIREPEKDNPLLGSDRLANNAFLYDTQEKPFKLKPSGHTDGFPMGDADPFGIVCPLSAHLRKVQPRDSNTDIGGSFDTLQRRIIRRGIQYGDPIAGVTVDDGKDRGLMFVCYQANIDKQFEFLVTNWANSDTNPNYGGGHDMIIGQSDAPNRERSFDVPLTDGSVMQLKTTDEWVIPTGGGYFFVPSITTLKNVIANTKGIKV